MGKDILCKRMVQRRTEIDTYTDRYIHRERERERDSPVGFSVACCHTDLLMDQAIWQI